MFIRPSPESSAKVMWFFLIFKWSLPQRDLQRTSNTFFFSAFKLPFFDPFVIFVGDLGQFVENIKEGSKFAVIDFCSEEVEIE